MTLVRQSVRKSTLSIFKFTLYFMTEGSERNQQACLNAPKYATVSGASRVAVAIAHILFRTADSAH